jgi:hypothetical protein
MSRHRSGSFLGVALVSALVLAGCGPIGGTPAPSDAQASQLEEFARLRAAREAALAEMSVAELAGELQKESETRLEPFNSMALREMVSRGEEAAAELAELLVAEDRKSFFGLLALRAMSERVYQSLSPELRLSILVDALQASEYFNTWGIPDLYWEDAAQAIIDEGTDAEKVLTPLLDDKRPAPVWGEEEYAHFQEYQYRVADYALALILAIRGDERPIPADPGERDQMITAL